MAEVLKIEDVRKYFSITKGFQNLFQRNRRMLHAVDGVSFSIESGETFGLAGESGCGKTTLARLICLLEYPTSGKILFSGEDTSNIDKKHLRGFYKQLQMVFQDPLSSLNPRKTIEQILSKPLSVQEGFGRSELRDKIMDLLDDVDLKPPEDYISRYPHELSGGEKQRVVIARAVALRPKLVIADEPVASLDMSIRGKVLNLLRELQSRYGMSYLLITHDLRVLRVMSKRIAIMYLGKIAEVAKAEELFAHPCHPYTKGMISAELIPDPSSPKRKKGFILKGEVPSPIDPPPGCRFHTRCHYKESRCTVDEPRLIEIGNQHLVSCHFWKTIADQPI